MAVLTLAAALGAPAAAQAGTYYAHACSTPAGQTLGPGGWTVERSGPALAADRCGDGAGLEAALDPREVNRPGDFAAWRFDAPAGTSITSTNMEYLGRVGVRSGEDNPRITFGSNAQQFFSIESEGGYDGGVGYAVAGGRFLRMRALCGGTADCRPQDPKARFAIRRVTVELEDTAPPRLLGPATGSLTEPGPRSGVQRIAFSAREDGGGLYRVHVEADGRLIDRVPVDANGGACADLGGWPSSDRDFPAAVPCVREASPAVDVDTARFGPDGEHDVRVRVEDAAGNLTDVWSGRVTTANGEGPNGTGATPDARLTAGVGRSLTRGSVTVRYGRRPQLAGRLTGADGRPIANARLDLLTRVAPTAPYERVGEVRTASDGAYRLTLPAGPSRTVRVGYRARSTDPDYARTADVGVRTIAGLTMRPSTRRTRNRRKVTFRGRLLGAPAGSRKVVEIQVVSRGRWRPVDSDRIDDAGRFAVSYRFLRTFRTETYRFRAIVRKEAGFPYETGRSGIRRVTVRR